MKITKDTTVCISLAKNAGNFGTTIYNHVFDLCGLDFLYKSFSTEDLHDAIKGATALGIRGISITMPYKTEVLSYVDECSPEVLATNAANTIVNDGSNLIAYNTDADSTRILLLEQKDKFDQLFILGKGGFSKAVQYSARGIFSKVKIITRKNWDTLQDIESGLVFNCTPVEGLGQLFSENNKICFIDADVKTSTGKRMAVLQAARQFELYTGKKFLTDYVLENLENILEGK